MFSEYCLLHFSLYHLAKSYLFARTYSLSTRNIIIGYRTFIVCLNTLSLCPTSKKKKKLGKNFAIPHDRKTTKKEWLLSILPYEKELFQKLLQFTPKIPFNSWIVPEEILHQSTNCRGLLLPARPRRKRKSNTLWTLVTRKRRCHEYHQPTRRRNWEPRTIKHESIRTTVNFTRFKYHPRRGQTPLVNLVQVHEETPLISVLKHPRKLFHNEKEESSDHLEYDDFIPNCSVNSSSEDIFTQSKMAKRNGKFTAPNVPTTWSCTSFFVHPKYSRIYCCQAYVIPWTRKWKCWSLASAFLLIPCQRKNIAFKWPRSCSTWKIEWKNITF